MYDSVKNFFSVESFRPQNSRNHPSALHILENRARKRLVKSMEQDYCGDFDCCASRNIIQNPDIIKMSKFSKSESSGTVQGRLMEFHWTRCCWKVQICYILYNTNENLNVYMMNVMTFGTSCLPCVAHFVKNRNAILFAEKYHQVVNATCKNHYVDGWL